MPPIVPQSITACVIYADDPEGIRREAVAAAREGFRVALNAEQVGALESWYRQMARDAVLGDHSEE